MKKKTARLDWTTVPVSEVAQVNPRETLPPRDADDLLVPLYEMAAIDEFAGVLREPAMVHLSACRSGRTKFRNGDVLFAKITPCVQNGKSALASGIEGDLGFGSSEFYVLRAKSKILPEYLFFFVRQKSVVQSAVESFSGTSGRQRVPTTFWDRLTIPVPPLPVQERIVQILQRADEMRQKRQEALKISDAILPSIFHHTFETDGRKWPRKCVGEIVRTKSGGTPSRKRPEFWSGSIPWVSPSDMKVTEIYDTEEHISEKAIDESATNLVDPNTILVVVRSGILAHTFPVAIARTAVTFNQDIRALLPEKEILVPEYLLWALKARAPHVLMSVVKRGSTVHSIDSSRFLDMTVPVPPIAVQRTFVSQVEQLVTASGRLHSSASDSENLFGSLLTRAFTGDLTLEWEATNSNWINAQIELQERLPRLLLLAIIRESVRARKINQAPILITALMKYAFLFQMEGNGGRRFYRFVPYHYGPFASEVYDDLKRLQAEGLASIDYETDNEKTRITLTDTSKADAALAELPGDMHEDIVAVLDAYGEMDLKVLLNAVYKKYPAYAKKSRLSRGRSVK